jgi:hypothetical protein
VDEYGVVFLFELEGCGDCFIEVGADEYDLKPLSAVVFDVVDFEFGGGGGHEDGAFYF